MKKLSFKNIAINVFLALLVGLGIAHSMELAVDSGLGIAGSIFAIGTGSQLLFKHSLFAKGSLNMAIEVEVWVKDIQENLFFENEFLNLAVDHSAYVINSVVHIPQSGANPTVVKNRTELVADLQQRTDTEITYGVDNYTTDPFLVKNIDDLQLSYSKRQSVLGQHIATLGDTIAVNTLQAWAVTGSTTHVLRTTGTDSGDEVLTPSATGTRKLLTKRDLARAAAIMDLDKVPKQGRYAIIPTTMYYNLFTDTELIANRARLSEDLIKTGVVGDIHGFKIIYRGTVVRYTSAAGNNIRAEDSAGATTDCAGTICFSSFAVSQAIGEIMVYLNEGEARSYGDIMSAEVNQGASFLRAGNYGRVCIAQAVGA
jgi:hypothetical protein